VQVRILPEAPPRTPVAQWTERCPATAAVAGSTPAGRATSRGRSSVGRAPGFHPGETRSIRVVRSRIGLWCNSSMASSNLADPGANPGGPVLNLVRRGPERLGYLWSGRPRPCGSIPRIRPHSTTATHKYTLPWAGAVPVIATGTRRRGGGTQSCALVWRGAWRPHPQCGLHRSAHHDHGLDYTNNRHLRKEV